MKIKSIASSSSGNCYIVESAGEQLLIDCGIPVKKIRKAIGTFENVVACLVSHEHGDHAKYLPQLEKETYVTIACNRATKTAWNLNTNVVYTITDCAIKFGNFYFQHV